MIAPKPGLYRDIPYPEYASAMAVNQTALKVIDQQTPKHAKAYMHGRYLGTDGKDRRFGRAQHCFLLEPATFEERFLVANPCAELLVSGQRKGETCGATASWRESATGTWFCGTHAKARQCGQPEDYISETDMDRIRTASRELLTHNAVRLLRQHGGCEVTLFWERDGILCKGRVDKLIEDGPYANTIIDLKKIQPGRGTDAALQKAIHDYGYDMQAAWYSSGVGKLIGTNPHFAWIFMEDAEPFDVRAVEASAAMLVVGEAKVRRAWEVYRQCYETGHWPGYSNDIEQLSPADWELKRYSLMQ